MENITNNNVKHICWHIKFPILGAILGPSWGHLGAIWGATSGQVLGATLGHLGAILGAHQGPSWGSTRGNLPKAIWSPSCCCVMHSSLFQSVAISDKKRLSL